MEDSHWYSVVIGIISALTLLGGCATRSTTPVEIDQEQVEKEERRQRMISFRTRFQRQKKLSNLSYPLRKANSSICSPDTAPFTGLNFGSKFSFEDEWRGIAQETLNVDTFTRVVHVVENSPADRVGITKGDRIVSINNWSVPEGKPHGEGFMTPRAKPVVEEVTNRLRQVTQGESITIKTRSNGETDTHALTPEWICDYEVHLVNDDAINAFADGRSVGITTGMMRFTRTDTELTIVIAHELAHNAMNHITKKRRNKLLGSLLDIAAATQGINTRGLFGNLAVRAYSPEFEAEADYVGLYFMARAGIDISETPSFWRRMSAAHPDSLEDHFLNSHPPTPKRFIALEETIQEIRQKKESGKELKPNYQKSDWFP